MRRTTRALRLVGMEMSRPAGMKVASVLVRNRSMWGSIPAVWGSGAVSTGLDSSRAARAAVKFSPVAVIRDRTSFLKSLSLVMVSLPHATKSPPARNPVRKAPCRFRPRILSPSPSGRCAGTTTSAGRWMRRGPVYVESLAALERFEVHPASGPTNECGILLQHMLAELVLESCAKVHCTGRVLLSSAGGVEDRQAQPLGPSVSAGVSGAGSEIGRASCREREARWGAAGSVVVQVQG